MRRVRTLDGKVSPARPPAGCRYVETIDLARDRRQMKIVFAISAALLVGGIAYGLWQHRPNLAAFSPLKLLAAAVLSSLYIPLHELTHGAAMYALSGVKPRYGLKLPYAYAGSDAWFSRRAHALIALLPACLWGAALFAAERAVPREWYWAFFLVQLSNLSGSAGDFYCVWHLASLPGELYVRDSGVRMRVVVRDQLTKESA